MTDSEEINPGPGPGPGPGREPRPLSDRLEVDLAVIGSGAAGLSAALTAAAQGLRVAVFEKAPKLGGTSAWCSGWMWIPAHGLGPASDHGASLDAADRRDAETGLRTELGKARFERQARHVRTYLDAGPEMLRFFRERFPETMAFEVDAVTPDFHATRSASPRGRLVRAQAFNGRRLRDRLEQLRRPLPEFTLAGLAIEAGKELDSFLYWRHSLAAFGRVATRLLGYVRDLALFRRDMRLVNGNALVARLLASALELEDGASRRAQDGGPACEGPRPPEEVTDQTVTTQFARIAFFVGHRALELLDNDGRVEGLRVMTSGGRPIEAVATAGVVLACGGFPHDAVRIRQLLPTSLTVGGHLSAAPEENEGDGLRLAEGVGARVVALRGAAAAYAPVSIRRRRDGTQAVYPHFIDRAKPGAIMVRSDGRRFCDEAGGYHDVVLRWLEATPQSDAPQAWLVCDAAFLLKYGLGTVGPFNPLPISALRDGYLKAGLTLQSLAGRCGIDGLTLRDEVRRFNDGVPNDPTFGRGELAYERSQGDPWNRPNPCLARLRWPPFFAVSLQVGSLGTLAGLKVDDRARVLGGADVPIAGLYACGNDMAGVMGGSYPGNGVTLGSAMIFGHLAGLTAAGARLPEQVGPSPMAPAANRAPLHP